MGKDSYHDKPKNIRKDGTIEAGKGKARPHHKEAKKRVLQKSKGGYHEDTQQKIGKDTLKHRIQNEENKYIPQTANKYQHNLKKVGETSTDVTYEWYEDNGHKDHIQYKRKTVTKDGSEPIVLATITNKQYQENFKEIFGDRKRGVEREGGYKKFKKTYK